MTRRHIDSGTRYEALAAYSRAVVDGDWIFVSGTTGYRPGTGEMADDAAEQTRQALANISQALGEAGASLADVVRVRVYVADREAFDAVLPVFGEVFRSIRPANTTVLCQLVEPHMKVEIEATARRRR